MTRNWYDFYKDRVNSRYQSYFEVKYKSMIDLIQGLDCRVIREEGVGICSLSKALKKRNNDYVMYGFDIDEQMLNLAKANNTAGIVLYQDNIVEPKKKVFADTIITHGVLEHFQDYELLKIRERYKNNSDIKNIVHYVPTDLYLNPSFGDERLMSVEWWLNLYKPEDYITFNDNFDLLLIN